MQETTRVEYMFYSEFGYEGKGGGSIDNEIVGVYTLITALTTKYNDSTKQYA